MSTFEERKQAFENKFKYDQDIRFKINSRRVRLVGGWAAERLGFTGEEAEAYAQEVVAVDIDKPCHADAIHKLRTDFKNRGLEISDHRIAKELERQWEIARQQVAPPVPV